MLCTNCLKGKLKKYAVKPFPSVNATIEYKKCPVCGKPSKYHVTYDSTVFLSENACDACVSHHLVTKTTKPDVERGFTLEYQTCKICGSKYRFYSSFLSHTTAENDNSITSGIVYAALLNPDLCQKISSLIQLPEKERKKLTF